ncbi:MAG: peptidoglycan binding domain-containing protein [Oliverpabstia sp.]|nr:peptidoglycan binding domain-containing protein [Oliverpabstia sp.]
MNHNKKKIIKITLGVLAGYFLIMMIGYMGVVFYFSNHFQKGTTINGISCENKTVEQVKQQIQKQIGDYKLKIKEKDGKTETISAVQVELSYVDDQKVEELLDMQNPWRWMKELSKKKTYKMETTTTYNEELLEEVLDELSCFQKENIIAPQDAYIKREGEEYVIVPEVEGTTLKEEVVEKVVKEAIQKGDTEIDLEELECYEKPSLYQKDASLLRELEEKNEKLQAEQTAQLNHVEII